MVKKFKISLILGVLIGIVSLFSIKSSVKAETYPTLNGDLFNGAKISFAEPGDNFSWLKITPTVTNWNGATAVEFRIMNATSIDSPVQFSIHETSAEIFVTNQDNENDPDTSYFISMDGSMVEKKVKWGNVWIPANFNGTMIIPLESFNDLDPNTGDNLLDINNIYAIFLGVNIQYNSFEKLYFGEIAVVNNDNTSSTILDFTSLSQEDFTKSLIKDPDINSQKAIVSRVELDDIIVPAPAKRIGDVKILESFDYPNQEALLQTITTWTDGSPLEISKYDDVSQSGSAMRVDIGSPEAGKNIYGSINIMPTPFVTDWTVWNDGGEDSDQVAKGITFWAKNLSSKEITINLEFDEFTKENYGLNGEDYTHERHNIKYGAMIMLMDKDGNEFIVHSKPTFAIPVGFEGWVRIPMSQYWIPEWCTWGDGELDLSKSIDGIFLTSDTTKNEGLSFAIDSVGIYYNNTEISSLFHNPDNSFKNNIGLE